MKIGLYFGSFNPIHIGHLIIASFVADHTDCKQVWFVVSPQNPFKNSATLLNENHRKHLVSLAVEGDDRFMASSVEFKLPKPSYTIDTLTHLSAQYPHHEFVVIMGSDSFQNLSKWKNAEILQQNYDIIVYERPGHSVGNHDGNKKVQVLTAPLLDISSTFIRSQVKAGKSIRYLVPDIVREEIEGQNYYR